MNLIDRVKNILLTPQKEWHVINSEPGNTANITTTYILPLTLIGTLAAFIGFGFFGVGIGVFKVAGVGWGIKMALGYAIRSILGVFVLAFIIDALASNFGSEKNFEKSFQVAAYSATAGLVGGIFLLVPALSILAMLASLYGLYLLFLGLPILKKTPADKAVSYFVVVLVVAILVGILLYYIQNLLFYPRLEVML
ncbi:MAG TPA: Yip1 family protein [Chitinophagaceae bacterium]|nr:Yip1 family protein [Chitinophagaceae bacterium]